MRPLTFTVPGKPEPQGSKRHVGRGVLVESAAGLGPWRERVAIAAHNAMVAAGRSPTANVAVSLELTFVMPRPASARKLDTPAVKRPDLDKLERAVLDALTHVCFVDDSAVVTLKGHKRLALPGETPRLFVRLSDTIMNECAGQP